MKYVCLALILLVTLSHLTVHAQLTNQGRLVNMQFLREIMRDRLAKPTTQKPPVVPPQKPSYPPWGLFYVNEDFIDRFE
ncbi:hypothetical protein ACF0H5_018232 [Mactra antiquata]